MRIPQPFDLTILRDSGLRFAVAGVCHWHAEYYRETLTAAGTDLVGAADADTRAGATKAGRWGIPFSDSLAALVRDCRPNFLFVLPRHDRAPDEVAAAAATGLPFMVEKPLGLDAIGAARAAKASDKAGVFADTCLPMRHTSIWSALGDIHPDWTPDALAYAHFRTINGPPDRYAGYGVPWMLDGAISGGGALRNLGFHGVDAAIVLAGGAARLTVEGAALTRQPGDGVERFASAILRTDTGAVITLEAGYAIAAPRGTDQEWRISTDRALMCQHDGGLSVHHQAEDAPRRHAQTGPAPYAQMLANSVGAFTAGLPPTAPMAEAVAAAGLIDRIYAKAINEGVRA